MGPVQRVIVKTAMRSVRHPKMTLAIALVMLIASIFGAMRFLGISSDENQLFSEKETYFRDYIAFSEKFPENEAIYVVVQKVDAAAHVPLDRWALVAETLAEKIGKHRVEYRAAGSQMGQWGLIFDSPERVREARTGMAKFGKMLKTIGEKPAPLDQLGIGTAPAERLFRAMNAATQEQTAEAAGFIGEAARSLTETITTGAIVPPDLGRESGSPRDMGYFFEKDQLDKNLPDGEARHLLIIRVHESPDFTSLTALSEKVEGIRSDVAAVMTQKAFPEFTATLTGRPVLGADELRISEHDTRISEIIAGIAVFIGMIIFFTPWSEMRRAASVKRGAVIFFRGVWLALLAEISLAIGVGWTFGWATISVGRLNLLSLVFVIALIGIGMDYLIQFVSRYRREAMRYARPTAIWARVLRYVSPPISTACLGAAGAFLVSIFTPFQGAAELGIIAGGGLLLCLLSGYTVLPALLTLFPPGIKVVDASERYTDEPQRGGGWRLAFPVVWIVLAIALIPMMMRVSFDPNLLNLQAKNLKSVQLVRHLETWYAVVLSEDKETLRKVRDEVIKAETVDRTDSLVERDDNAAFLASEAATMPKINWIKPAEMQPGGVNDVSGALKSLARTLNKIGTIRTRESAARLTALAAAIESAGKEKAAAMMTQWQGALLQTVRESLVHFAPAPLEIEQIPPQVRQHYVHLPPGGKPLYALYIYPKKDLWDQQNLETFVRDIEARALPLQKKNAGGENNFTLTGLAPEIFHTTAAIERSFYTATIYALVLIFILVLIDLRSITQTLAAISVLALGLPMLLAIMGGLQNVMGEYGYLVRFNLANFFGLPILIGAGHEYGVFMVHRYKETLHNPRRVWNAWDVSDRALLLCAYVTCSAFAFLLLGRHRGMQSLGFVMAAGTACIYLATIFVVRPILLWRLKRKASR